MAGVSPARQAAFQILLTVEHGQAHSDDLLRGNAVSRLSTPDRHLATALVLGVLRWQGQLDRQLRAWLAKPNARLDTEVLIALRMGAFQLLRMDRIPARAAIDESVELAKRAGHSFAARMVNAVLRKLAGAAHESAKDDASSFPDSTAAAAHPAWMVDRWKRFFGPAAACAICEHDQAQPSLAIRLGGPEVESELAESGAVLAPGAFLTAARVVAGGDVAATAAFREGRVRIQDEGSQLVAEIAAAVDSEVSRILDCCAAPGGKTLILAERRPAANIVACEASAPRLESLRERIAEFGKRIECQQADAAVLRFESEFDLVLADVPCSGTGTLSRNPEIRHRLQPEDLPRQAERQRAILGSALKAVRAGGRVVYSTCSLEPEENEQVIAAVLAENPSARIAPPTPAIDLLRNRGVITAEGAARLQACVTPEGFLRLVPGAFGTDGFFIAMIDKGERDPLTGYSGPSFNSA